jgi:transposase
VAKPGLLKKNRYSEEFKAGAVMLSHVPGVLMQDVAESLGIHFVQLSRWRKQAREGLIVAKGVKVDAETAHELKRLRQLEKEHALLKVEHELLKKAIRFAAERKQKSLPSSTQTGKPTKLP